MAQRDILEELETHRNETNKYNSVFTYIIYDMSAKELSNKIRSHIDKCKSISYKTKRDYLIKKLLTLVEYLKVFKEPIVNGVILFNEEIRFISLVNYTNMFRDYNIDNYTFLYGSEFHIDYIKDLLNNFNFIHVVSLKQTNILTHSAVTSNKTKVILNKKVDGKQFLEYIKELPEKSIIYGSCLLFSKILEMKERPTNYIYIEKESMTNDELVDIHNKENIIKLHNELKKYMEYLKNEQTMHLIIYGKKEIIEAINEYKIKILFCHRSCIDTLNNIDTMDKTKINFPIHEIDKISDEDISCQLLDGYGGFLGVTYY